MEIKQSESITLIKPQLSMQQEFYQYCQAFREANEPADYWDDIAYADFSKFIKRMQDNESGVDLPAGDVSFSIYWLVRDGHTILGRSSFRYTLTPELEEWGGNIGYRINPKERCKGYGTLILKLTLEKARERGLHSVLLTCYSTNVGSMKIIQNNGGILTDKRYSEEYSQTVLRYWISL